LINFLYRPGEVPQSTYLQKCRISDIIAVWPYPMKKLSDKDRLEKIIYIKKENRRIQCHKKTPDIYLQKKKRV